MFSPKLPQWPFKLEASSHYYSVQNSLMAPRVTWNKNHPYKVLHTLSTWNTHFSDLASQCSLPCSLCCSLCSCRYWAGFHLWVSHLPLFRYLQGVLSSISAQSSPYIRALNWEPYKNSKLPLPYSLYFSLCFVSLFSIYNTMFIFNM